MAAGDAVTSTSRRFQTELFTAGLENGGPPALLEELAAEDIELVVDIRRWPARHWRRFSPNELAPLFASAEIHYVSHPALGPEPKHWVSQARQWRADSRAFRHHLRSRLRLIAWAAGLALRHRTCVISQFPAPRDEDRRVVAEEIAKLAGLRVLRLRGRPAGRLDPTQPTGVEDLGVPVQDLPTGARR